MVPRGTTNTITATATTTITTASPAALKKTVGELGIISNVSFSAVESKTMLEQCYRTDPIIML